MNSTLATDYFCANINGQCAKVMGILNITPDSFFDGGHFTNIDHALKQAEQMVQDGAVILDIGGESTRPGAQIVSAEQELARVIPVIEAIRQRFDCAISIDTSKAAVMRSAIEAGAHIINDVKALSGPNCMETAAELGVPVCLMHMQGEPRTMQADPSYNDVIEDIKHYLLERITQCERAGIAKKNIIVDPGFGFGKTLVQNYQLLNQLQTFATLGCTVMVGMSRKSMIGNLLNNSVEQRLIGSVSCAVIAAMKGAAVIRVHDVKATVEAIKIVSAVDDPAAIS
jgi:dihydropteroate synthase